MGIFLAKYLQYDNDKEIYDSLMKYYRFVTREFYDEETGEVYNTIGKDPSFKRLYNAPWMSIFTLEMYNLTKDSSYWDGYCFGKHQMFGDTFPHPASVHTSNGFLHYAIITGDEKYKKKSNVRCTKQPFSFL